MFTGMKRDDRCSISQLNKQICITVPAPLVHSFKAVFLKCVSKSRTRIFSPPTRGYRWSTGNFLLSTTLFFLWSIKPEHIQDGHGLSLNTTEVTKQLRRIF